jgi:hypothetical protein
MGEDGDETKLPPLYTRPGDMDAVKSVLWQLDERPGPYTKAGRGMFRVYSVGKLFHELRNAIMGVPSAVIMSPNFLDQDELINDSLEFTVGLSCDFHEVIEAMRHCSLSYVQRWIFLIMEQCCGPLAIEIIPGQHCDLYTYLIKRARARCCKSNTVRHDKPSSRSLSGEPLSSKNKCQETTLMKNDQIQQVRAEEVVWPRRLPPRRPLRRPREPIEVILMRFFGQKRTSV